MTRRRILVVGEGVRAAIVGALVARRCVSEQCEVTIAGLADANERDAILARPDHRRFHDELGLEPGILMKGVAGIRPAFVADVEGPSGNIAVPFAPYGVARAGVDFHQFWLRADALTSQPELEDFSPSIAFARSRGVTTLAAAARLPLDYGLSIERGAYAAILLRHAQSLGAIVTDTRSEDACDLVIDCSVHGGHEIGWHGRHIRIATQSAIPGAEWQGQYNAAKRFLALSSDSSDSAAEQREYNRLAAAEADRLADFEGLLLAENPEETARPAVKRKIEVFSACGRIPTEDYEVFAPHEWLAALWSRGFRPARYDRMADAMPKAKLLAWLEQLHSQVRGSGSQERAA